MPTASKYASYHTAITTGYTNPSNGFDDDGVYATADPAKNSEVSAYWGFAGFTTSEIPDGAIINSVTIEHEFKVSTTASIADEYFQIFLGTTGQGTEQSDTTEPLNDKVVSHQVTSGISVSDLRTNNYVRLRTRSRRGNSNTAVTFYIDYVKITVDYFIPGGAFSVSTSANNTYATAYNNGRKLVRTSDGALHCVWADKRGTYYQIYYAKSTDNGETWTETALTNESYDQYNPSIAVDSNNYLHVVWYGNHSGSASYEQIRYRKYTGSWQPIENLTSGNYYQYHPSIAVDSNNYIHVVWCGGHPGSPPYFQIRYRKYTGSWQPIENLTSENYYQYNPSIAVDSNNYLHVVWYGRHSGSPSYLQIRYIKYTGSWSSIENLTSENYHQYNPSIAVDSNNYIHVVWYGSHSDSTTYTQIRYIKYTGSWQQIENLTSENYSQHNPSIAVDSNNYLHVVWQGVHSGSLSYFQIRYIKYTGSWSSIQNLTLARSDQYYPNLIWANFPEVSGVKTNRPKDGYAFVWTNNTSVYFFRSTDLEWEIIEASEEVSITDTGAGSDSLLVKPKANLFETGQGQDITPSIKKKSTLQDTGMGTDVPTLKKSSVLQDAGAGIDILTILKRILTIDTGTGTESGKIDRNFEKVIVQQLAIQKSVQDTGAGIETPLILKKFGIADGASGADLLSILKKSTISDTGIGTDLISILKRLSLSDLGEGTDILALLQRMTISDASTGSESINVFSVGDQKFVYDSGSGIDIANILERTTISDIGAGADILTILKKLIIGDIAAGIDVLAILNRITASDAAIGVDELTILKRILLSETAVGADAFSLLKRTLLSDTGTGSDLALILKRILVLDSGTGADLITIFKKAFLAESGIGSDNINVMVLGDKKFIFDNGLGEELIKVLNRFTVSDAATGIDAISAIKGILLLYDAGIATEEITIRSILAVLDEGKGEDEVLARSAEGSKLIIDSGLGADFIGIIKAILNIQDLGRGVDNLNVKTALKVPDSGAGIELLRLPKLFFIQDKGRGKEKIRARWNKWLCQTYQKKEIPFAPKTFLLSRKKIPFTPKTSPFGRKEKPFYQCEN